MKTYPIIKAASGNGLLNNLISCWEFDETSGTTAFDAHGSNDGTISNLTLNQSSVSNLGTSFSNNGGTGYVRFPIGTEENVFSLSVWFNASGYGGGGSGRIFDKTQNSIYGFLVYVLSPLTVYFNTQRSTTNGTWKIPDNAISFGSWYHLVVTYDRTSTSNDPVIYLNNVSQTVIETSTPDGTFNTSTNDLYCMNRFAGARGFDGYIDQPVYCNKILSPSGVEYLYNSYNGLPYTSWTT